MMTITIIIQFLRQIRSVRRSLADSGSCPRWTTATLSLLVFLAICKTGCSPFWTPLRCPLGLLCEAVRTHNSSAPRTPLVKSSRADQILAYRGLHGMAPSYLAGSLHLMSDIDIHRRLRSLTQPHWSYYLLITPCSANEPSQWLQLVHGTAFHLPSEMHHRWCYSAAADL